VRRRSSRWAIKSPQPDGRSQPNQRNTATVQLRAIRRGLPGALLDIEPPGNTEGGPGRGPSPSISSLCRYACQTVALSLAENRPDLRQQQLGRLLARTISYEAEVRRSAFNPPLSAH
jgi:hypothetical protein